MTGQSLTQTLETPTASRRGQILEGMRRGLIGRCPNCGQGKLYRAYLKVTPCQACGHDNTQYHADDAGPYFTILLVGHIVIGPMLFMPFIWRAPTALVIGTTLPTIAVLSDWVFQAVEAQEVLTLLLLPRVKGAIIGLHWALNCKGDPSGEAF